MNAWIQTTISVFSERKRIKTSNVDRDVLVLTINANAVDLFEIPYVAVDYHQSQFSRDLNDEELSKRGNEEEAKEGAN